LDTEAGVAARDLVQERLSIMWDIAPALPVLHPGEVHVWRAETLAPPGLVTAYLNTLSQDERDRAARFHFAKGRENYVVARGILRALLGIYLDCAPASVKLTYTAHGKPGVDASRVTDLRFNLAHSGDLALFAFARGARIGIDVERCRSDFDGQRIADRFFTERESSALRAVRDSERVRAFTQQWTRKESFIKAHGEGLSFPLNAFAVIEEGSGALRLKIGDAPESGANWHICDLDIGDDYAAAVAVELISPVVCTYRWSGPHA
jgi:4'-phosphopantetheinyl transferase